VSAENKEEEFDPILMYTLKSMERDAWRPERYEIIYGVHDRRDGRYMGSTMESLAESCKEYYDMNSSETFLKLTEAVTDFVENRITPKNKEYYYFVNKLEEWFRDRVRQYFNILEGEEGPVDTQVPAYEIDWEQEQKKQEMFNLWIRGYSDREIAKDIGVRAGTVKKWREKMKLKEYRS